MAAHQALGARHADGGGRCGGERHVKTSLERECHTLQAERRAVCFSRHKRSILSRKGPDYGWGLGAAQGMVSILPTGHVAVPHAEGLRKKWGRDLSGLDVSFWGTDGPGGGVSHVGAVGPQVPPG